MEENGKYKRAHKAIEDLLPTLKGESLTREQWYRLLNIIPGKKDHIPFKDAVNAVLWNMSQVNKKKKIEKVGSLFKVVDDDLVPINFSKDGVSRFDLTLPFDIHKYCFLYRKNIGIVFGSKDSGKTAFMLNVVRLNMHKHRVVYFSSEMVEDEFKVRLGKYKGLDIEDWTFEPYERSYDFDQVIQPDAFNIVDFLELGGDDSEYYKGVALVRRIYDKLDGGAAFIACQKNKDASLPKGGSGLLEKARIAISLDPGKVELVVAKNWADGIETSPTGTAWTYKLVGGINIMNPQEYFEEV